MTGAAVVYKTKFQRTVAMSSTEAEFVAASEAGKYALYLCSLLNDLDEPQQHALILYEDNAYQHLTLRPPRLGRGGPRQVIENCYKPQ